MTYAEYVAREAVADVKHEFIRGEDEEHTIFSVFL